MKNKYDNRITLTKMFYELKKNFISILCFSITCFLMSSFALAKFTTNRYVTTGQVTNKFNITTTVFSTIRDVFKSDIVVNRTVNKLAENNVIHANSDKITKNEVANGISFPNNNNSFCLTISFYGKDKTTICATLNTMIEVAIDYFKNDLKRGEFTNLVLSREASSVSDASNKKMKAISFTLCAAVVSYMISFMIDYKYDFIYCSNDIKDLNTNVFELNYDERKKNKKYE